MKTTAILLLALSSVGASAHTYSIDWSKVSGGHPSVDDRPYLNVVAQEFAEVLPEYVKSSGEKVPEGSEILQVDTYPLTIYSAAAVQELAAKVESGNRKAEQEDAKIAAPEARLEKFERMLAVKGGNR